MEFKIKMATSLEQAAMNHDSGGTLMFNQLRKFINVIVSSGSFSLF